MKVAAREIKSVLAALDPSVRAVLVYGRDEGLVRERATKIAKQIASDLSDPFQVVRPSPRDVKETPSLLMDEMQALSMMGGRRLILLERVPTAAPDGPAVLSACKAVLASDAGEGLLVVTAGSLARSAALVKAFEGSKSALSIACYEEGERDIAALVQDVVQAAGKSIDPAAHQRLVGSLGSDRGVSRSELDKLILYKGTDDTPISLADVEAAVGDSAAADGQRVVEAAMRGDLPLLDRALERAAVAGINAVQLLRALQSRLMQLSAIAAHIKAGSSFEAAAGRVIPRHILFLEKDRARDDLSRLSGPAVDKLLDRLLQDEIAVKTTGNPDHLIVARAFMAVAETARRGSRRTHRA